MTETRFAFPHRSPRPLIVPWTCRTPALQIELKYYDGKPVINEIKRVSTPGRRVYSGISDLPRTYNGLGISILSTPRGVMSDNEARAAHVGGEVLCQVF